MASAQKAAMSGFVGTSSYKASMGKTQCADCKGCNGHKQQCTCPCANYCPDCGMPKCRAARETKWAPGTLCSEFTREYTEKKATGGTGKTELPGKAYVDSRGKFDPATTQNTDFTLKSAQVNRAGKPGIGGTGPARPFDGRTTYKTEHDGKKGPRSEALGKKLDTYSAPFYGTTTHQAEFTPKPLNVPAGFAPKYDLINQPFDGQSTYAADFDKKRIPDKLKKAPAPELQSVNTDNYTTYGVDYVPLPLSKSKVGNCCANVRHTAVHVDLTTLSDGAFV